MLTVIRSAVLLAPLLLGGCVLDVIDLPYMATHGGRHIDDGWYGRTETSSVGQTADTSRAKPAGPVLDCDAVGCR